MIFVLLAKSNKKENEKSYSKSINCSTKRFSLKYAERCFIYFFIKNTLLPKFTFSLKDDTTFVVFYHYLKRFASQMAPYCNY